jgi:hypothetical protein
MENESSEESLGEMMVNLIPVEQTDSLRNATTFERYLGGSSANIAAYVSKLGGRSAVIVKTGISAFGEFPVTVSDGEKVARIGPLSKAKVENETGRFVNKVGVLKLRIVGHVERMIDCETPYRRLDTLAVQHA